MNNKIGYIICEDWQEPTEVKLQPKMINGKVVGEGILQTANEKNRNGRYYAKEELFPQLTCPRTLELLNAGYLRAEMGHPLSSELQRQSTIDDTKTCAKFLKLWTNGFDIWAHFVGTNNEYGKAFDLDLKEGCMPAWSLRALGTVTNTRNGAEVKNLRLITWDNVIYPSHPGAYTQRLVTESVAVKQTNSSALMESANSDTKGNIIIPFTNTSVINFLQSQSGNLKFVRECFDFAFSEIKVNESGTKAILKTIDGDTLVVNMESYVHNELMNYAKEYEFIRK
jgi:hypothetical protein